MSRSSLKRARTALLLRQTELAELAGLSVATIIRCENGESIQLLSAQAILQALNTKRAERNLEPLELEDLDWIIKQ